MHMIRTCKHCSKTFNITNEPKGFMANHVRWCDENPTIKEARSNKAKTCKACGELYYNRNKTYCSNACVTGSFKHSVETKTVLSKKRKTFLKENPDKHPWRYNDKFVSQPSEIIKERLRDKNVDFIEEYIPLNSERNYSIDIAMPDKMLCIEVNGNQHYDRKGNLQPYYKERHDYLVSLGWNVIELHYSYAYSKDLNDILDNILTLKYDDSYFSYEEYFKMEYKRKRRIKLLKRVKTAKSNKLKSCHRRQSVEILEECINSGIDFTKFGWVNKASKIIGCKPQKVSVWFKKWHPEFYEKKCFTRN